MIYAHHLTAPHANDQTDRGELIEPDVHHADFRLSEPEGRFDNGFELHAALQEVIRAFGGRDGIDVFPGGADFDAEAGEGIEGFEDIVFEVLRNWVRLAKVAEEPGFGDGGVFQVRQGEFADQEKPVGMAGPFDVEVVVEAEVGLDVEADQFVGDGAVVDAVDRNAVEVELIACLADVTDVGDADASRFRGQQKIGERFLVVGVDFEQDDVFGCVVAQDGALEESLVVALFCNGQVVDIAIGVFEDGLVGVERGKGLYFHQFRGDLAGVVANQSEVRLDEHGLFGFVLYAESRRDLAPGRVQTGFVLYQLMDEFRARFLHRFDEWGGEETRCFADAEFDVRPAAQIEAGDERPVFFWRKGLVKGAAQFRDHQILSLNGEGCHRAAF